MFYLWPENIWQQLPTNMSFNTVLHQRSLQGRGTIDKSQVLLPLSNNAAFSLLFTDRNKSPHYYILWHILPRLSFHSLQHQSQILQQLHKRKLNRTTLFSQRAQAQNWGEIHSYMPNSNSTAYDYRQHDVPIFHSDKNILKHATFVVSSTLSQINDEHMYAIPWFYANSTFWQRLHHASWLFILQRWLGVESNTNLAHNVFLIDILHRS
jgi:hypothetical protein